MILITRVGERWAVEYRHNKSYCDSEAEVLRDVRVAMSGILWDEAYQRDLQETFRAEPNDSAMTLAEEDAALDNLKSLDEALKMISSEHSVSVSQLAERAGVRREYVLAEIKRGNLVAQKIGHPYTIPEWAAQDWLAKPRRGSRSK